MLSMFNIICNPLLNCLLEVMENKTSLLDDKDLGILHSDFKRTFDFVPHDRFLIK